MSDDRPLTDEDPMPMGTHQGKPMRKVPARYLDWLLGQPWFTAARSGPWARVRQYVLENQTAIQAEIQDDD
jgi:uncharacterized protein (DUF3820 family)